MLVLVLLLSCIYNNKKRFN